MLAEHEREKWLGGGGRGESRQQESAHYFFFIHGHYEDFFFKSRLNVQSLIDIHYVIPQKSLFLVHLWDLNTDGRKLDKPLLAHADVVWMSFFCLCDLEGAWLISPNGSTVRENVLAFDLLLELKNRLTSWPAGDKAFTSATRDARTSVQIQISVVNGHDAVCSLPAVGSQSLVLFFHKKNKL